MFTEEELQQMMNVGNENNKAASEASESPAPAQTVESAPETNVENINGGESEANDSASEQPSIEVASVASAPDAATTDNSKMTKENSTSVSDIILSNVDKHIKMVLLNDNIHAVNADADVQNYIVYVNTDKKIPCLYDCEGLRVPTSSVKNADGTWNVTSIEGRRSGFVIKCPGRDLVMTKNFVYDCTIDANNNITSVKEYNRKNEIKEITKPLVPDYDAAVLILSNSTKGLPKVVKGNKYKTMDELKEQVRISYESVNDINAMFKIVDLRLQLGC